MKSANLLSIYLVSLALTGCVKTEETGKASTTEYLIGEGVSYEDPTKRAALEVALKASGVPYTVESRDGSTYISWNAKHSRTVQLIQAKLFGPPLPSGRNLSSSPALQERFKAWLSQNRIPYRLQHSQGKEFVIWDEEFTPRVQAWEFFPPHAVSQPAPARPD